MPSIDYFRRWPVVRRSALAAVLAVACCHAASGQTLIQHLDASVENSLFDDGGVITWADQSGSGNNATQTSFGSGTVSLSTDATIFSTGLNSVRLEGGSQLQLLDPTAADTLLNQTLMDADGWTAIWVVRDDAAFTVSGGWNDIIGNTSVIGSTSSWATRWHDGNGGFQSSINGAWGGPGGWNVDEAFVMAFSYDPVTGTATRASSRANYFETVSRSPADFSQGNTASDVPLWFGATNNASRYFQGNVGEIKLYDGALSTEDLLAEISALDDKWTIVLDGRVELVVDLATGGATLSTPGAIDIDMFGIEILSASGSLDPSDWMSITDNYDSDSGDMSFDMNDPWLKLSETANELTETTLGAGAAITPGSPIDLGSIFELGGETDLDVAIVDPATGELIDVFVEYINEAPADLLPGDFNDDGTVDVADYTVWRDNLGQEVVLANETVSLGRVTIDDYLTWQDNFGESLPGAVAAAPEPGGVVLLVTGCLASTLLARCRRASLRKVSPRKQDLPAMRHVGLLGLAALLASATLAGAAVTVDRDYQLGEEEGGSAPNAVGSGGTFDSAGTPGNGTFVDLFPVGAPAYTDVSARPGAGPGAVGVSFDGLSDYLVNERGETATQTNAGGVGAPGEAFTGDLPGYNTTGRGFQAWVFPTNDTAGARQDVVNDTFQFGVHITAENKWAMTWGSRTTGGWDPTVGIERASDVDVAFNQWTHVMNTTDSGVFQGRLYVNGVVVAAGGYGEAGGWEQNTTTAREANEGVPGVQLLNLTAGASVDGAGNFFEGALDDLQVYLHGGSTGTTFNLGEDNDYVKGVLAGTIVDPNFPLPNAPIPTGDADLDGDVDDDDVLVFASHWRDVQTVELCCSINPNDAEAEPVLVNPIVGDLNSRLFMADFNFDGVTNWSDWILLRANHSNPGSLNLAAALAAVQTPEPSAGLLILVALLGGSAWRGRQGR